MPATSSGLETFGGGTGGSFGSNPNLTQSNALGNTPFLGGVANAGVGTGNLGQFGGYIPTPLPQFNNYTDYMTAMPGASQMDAFANIPISPGFYNYYTGVAQGLFEDVNKSPFQAQAMQGARQAAEYLGGWTEDQNTLDANGYPAIGMLPGGGVIQKDWFPAAERMFGYANQMADQAGVLFGQEAPLIEQQPRLTAQQDVLRSLEDPLIQQSFDPQQALYNRTVQQTQEQTRAGLEARGLDMSPYGAGVESSALSNFNIDWQNSQLQRELAGAQGVGGLASGIGGLAGQMNQIGQTVGQLGTAGGNLLTGAGAMNTSAAGLQDFGASELKASSEMMGDTWNKILQGQKDNLEWLGQYGQQAAQPYQQASQNWQNIQNQFLTANQQGFNQNQTSGFEDPFAMLQLQSQIEMQREQMNMQEEMQKKQMQQQMMMQGMQGAMGMMGGMGGK
jgi:hypothetical protein